MAAPSTVTGDFTERLDSRMKELGLDKSSLARRMGTTRQTVHQWLTGTTPREKSLQALATALGVHMQWIAYGDEPKEIGSEPPPPIDPEDLPDIAASALKELRHSLVDGSLVRGLATSSNVRAKALALIAALEEARG